MYAVKFACKKQNKNLDNQFYTLGNTGIDFI